MFESLTEATGRAQIEQRLRAADQHRRTGGVRRPKTATRHTLAASLRRFADRLEG